MTYTVVTLQCTFNLASSVEILKIMRFYFRYEGIWYYFKQTEDHRAAQAYVRGPEALCFHIQKSTKYSEIFIK